LFEPMRFAFLGESVRRGSVLAKRHNSYDTAITLYCVMDTSSVMVVNVTKQVVEIRLFWGVTLTDVISYVELRNDSCHNGWLRHPSMLRLAGAESLAQRLLTRAPASVLT
jgi:hypothetical protein